jgi:hypothetical protein
MSIILHPAQSEIYEDIFVNKNARFFVNVCSRGWGKSYLAAVTAMTAVFELLELPTRVPNKNVYIVAPTYDQVTDIYYPIINFELGMEKHTIKSSRDTGRFLFPKNVELRLISYEAIERLRGKGAYFVVVDEPSSYNKGLTFKEAWEGIIQPTIITRWSNRRALAYGAGSPGRALIIGTPKGYNFLYDMFNFQELDKSWKSYHYDYTSSPFLDVEEIERIKHTIDPVEFASEYLASFEDSGNNVFYCFDRKRHVTDDFEDLKPEEDVHVCIDFNVGLQCSSVFVKRNHNLHFFNEFKGHPDTPTLANVIKELYKGHKIYAYPDPTGNSSKTSAVVGTTDFTILRDAGITVLARSSSPSIVNSVAAVNRKLLTAAGDVQIYIKPHLRGLIESLERTSWVDKNPNTATIDKKPGIEHYSDGVRYAVEYLYPIVSGAKRTSRGFNF